MASACRTWWPGSTNVRTAVGLPATGSRGSFELVQEGQQRFDETIGLAWMLPATLQSSVLLSRVQQGEPVLGAPGVALLPFREMASRLS